MTEKKFIEKINPLNLKRDAIKDAEVRFDELVGAGIIKPECKFENNVWKTTDEYSNIGLYFTFEEESYDKQYRDYLGIEFDDFVYFLKCYILSIFGKNVLTSIRSCVLDVRHIISSDLELFLSEDKSIGISMPDATSDFFVLLPTERDMDPVVKALDGYSDRLFKDRVEKQRTLADMDSYFLFDAKLRDYWSRDLPISDRLFFYPLYLWWVVTVIIPTRPREFLLTERDCISRDDNGDYHLRLRKNKLKGTGRNISYNITDDYETVTYKVPPYVGEAFEDYIKLTDEYEPTKLDTLFVSDPHFLKWDQKKHSNSRFLTYINLRTILRYFYQEVLHGIYGLEIYYRYEDAHLKQGDICYIQLGDTRHLALINAMQQGGTPALAMLLAGHENPNQAMHYASNILTASKCRTYRKYLYLKGDIPEKHIIKPMHFPSRAKGIPLSDGGRCFSECYSEKVFTDCEAALGPDGEMAYCPVCPFYRPKGIGYFEGEKLYTGRIEDDCKMLEYVVNLVRKEKGGLEDIGEVVLKISADSEAYSQFLLEKEINNGEER